jgi:hypothetical protein
MKKARDKLVHSSLYKKALGEHGGSVEAIESKFRNKGDLYWEKGKRLPYVIKEDSWNIHMHILLFGKYVPQAELEKLWNKITRKLFMETHAYYLKDVFYVYIDEADDANNGLFETLKYMYKPPTLKTAENYALYYDMTKGLILTTNRGSFRGASLSMKRGGRKPYCGVCGSELEYNIYAPRVTYEEAAQFITQQPEVEGSITGFFDHRPGIIWRPKGGPSTQEKNDGGTKNGRL